MDNVGDAYLTGQTTSGASIPFPTTSGAYQATLNSQYGNVFVTEIATTLSGSQSLVFSTYFGGSSTIIVGDTGSGIGIGPSGKIYVGGDTTSADFPVTSEAFQTTNSAAGKAIRRGFRSNADGDAIARLFNPYWAAQTVARAKLRMPLLSMPMVTHLSPVRRPPAIFQQPAMRFKQLGQELILGPFLN